MNDFHSWDGPRYFYPLRDTGVQSGSRPKSPSWYSWQTGLINNPIFAFLLLPGTTLRSWSRNTSRKLWAACKAQGISTYCGQYERQDRLSKTCSFLPFFFLSSSHVYHVSLPNIPSVYVNTIGLSLPSHCQVLIWFPGLALPALTRGTSCPVLKNFCRSVITDVSPVYYWYTAPLQGDLLRPSTSWLLAIKKQLSGILSFVPL